MYWTWIVLVLSILGAGANADPEQAQVSFGCQMSWNKKQCLDVDGCYWCASQSFAAEQSVCTDKMQAKEFPPWFYKCSHKKSPTEEEVLSTPQTGCDTPRTEEECLADTTCVWCQNKFGPSQAHCTSAAQAKFIPKAYMKCKAASDDKPATDPTVQLQAVEGGVGPQPGMDCINALTKQQCLSSSKCYWCANIWAGGMGARCMDQASASYLPPSTYKCKKGKKPEPAPGPEMMAGASGGDDPTPPADLCKDATDKNVCKDMAGCSWCDNQKSPVKGVGSICMSTDQTKWLPATIFKCKASDATKGAATSVAGDPTPADPCAGAMDKKGCKDIDGCAWCENKFNPTVGSRCMGVDQTKFIPASVFKCKAGKTDAVVNFPGPSQPGSQCGMSTVKKACLGNPGCYWCTSAWGPSTMGAGQCMDEMEAKFLPASAYKCKAAKQPQVEDADEDEDNAATQMVQMMKVMLKAMQGGDAPPYTPPNPGGMGCQSALDQEACLGQKDCYWCANKFTPGMGARCTDASQAKFLPDMVFKCKKGKKPKKPDAPRKVMASAA